MTEKTDYRLTNIEKKEIKLRAQRQDILKSDSQTALSMILDSPAPASLIQSFPDQDLYYLMHKIGPYDFIPVLSLATSDQWEYMMDMDVWQEDRLDVPTMTKIFDLLFQADPQRLLRWIITEKPDFYEFYLLKNMDITVREHDDPPPADYDDYITLDDKFYFRFPDKPRLSDDQMPVPDDNQAAWELIETMLKSLAEMDLSVLHSLLLETKAVLPAETEEEQFRLKNLRLAEKGFLPTYEAIGIYQPVKIKSLAKRPVPIREEHKNFDPDIPLPPQFFSEFLTGDNLFSKTMKLFDNKSLLIIESELAALINKVISADRIRLRKTGDLELATSKTFSYLNLGLEIMLKDNFSPEYARKMIETYFLEDIFRTGSRAGLRLKTQAINWFKQSFMQKNNLPLSFLDQHYLGILGGLILDRPMFFDPDAETVAGTDIGTDFYRNFISSQDIIQSQISLDEIFAIDTILGKLKIDILSFTQGVLTYKSLILTLWAKNRLNMDSNLEPIPANLFQTFFGDLFPAESDSDSMKIRLDDLNLWVVEATGIREADMPSGFKRVLNNLVRELEDEYCTITPENIDPRFMTHFLLKD